MPSHHLAIDIGASSGRAVLGTLADGRLSLRELHRFPNTPVTLESGLHWDADKLLRETKHSLKRCAQSNINLNSLAIDTWGVDYALLDHNNQPLTPPHHYRDPRTRGLIQAAELLISRDRIYSRTGIQFMELNTLYQLLADLQSPDKPLAKTKQLLFTPDLLNFWLTGIARTETTIASTSQLFDTQSLTWADDLITAFGLPRHIFPTVSRPGSILGPLSPDITAGPTPVISVGSHDTASAVAAVPAPADDAADWAYISSGTWSLVGRELHAPIRTPQALAANFTNECGIEGTIRFHKNITGLWLLQECQRIWREQQRDYAAPELIRLATAAAPLQSFIDPDHPTFTQFGNMPEHIRDYCRNTNQPAPDSDAAITRCILESLALKTRYVLDTLESLTSPIRTLHIVGGGVQNTLLCQFTADAANRPVLAGPVEATAAGNIMTQALAQRAVTSLTHIRTVIASSLPPTRYEPQHAQAWNMAYARFRTLPLR